MTRVRVRLTGGSVSYFNLDSLQGLSDFRETVEAELLDGGFVECYPCEGETREDSRADLADRSSS